MQLTMQLTYHNHYKPENFNNKDSGYSDCL